MAAYGLYTHIQSNKRRSVALLIGLFLLVYVMVYAGALLAEAMHSNAPLELAVRKAWSDLIMALPWATAGTAVWIFIAYKFHQSMIDAVTGARVVTRKEEPRLYNLLENLCISRGITMPTLRVMDSDALNAFATGLNDKQYSDHRHHRAGACARRPRDRGRARPRTDAHPQRRCPHDGDRGGHRRRDRFLRRTVVPQPVLFALELWQRALAR